ncbi:MAG: epimerase [Rickettsiales bacterium]|nr:epimerase [Rickettsiales bacterium]
MQYLVTGGAGFIGSHLTQALSEHGHSVTVIDDLSTGHRDNVPEGVTFIEGDCGDAALIPPLLAKADGVFHLAAIASVQRSREDWAETSRVNQFATIKLLDAIKHSGRKTPFVYASSAAVYGDPDASQYPLTEATPTAPLTPYGVDKLGSEWHADVARTLFGIPTLGLRFFNVFGPRQDPSSPYSGVISIFVNRIARGEAVTIFGDGQQTRDFIYVGDVVKALAAAMQQLEAGNQPPHRALNICTGVHTSVQQLAEQVATICQTTPQITNAAAREGDIRTSVGNPTAMQQYLGVTGTTAFRDGLQQTIAWATTAT